MVHFSVYFFHSSFSLSSPSGVNCKVLVKRPFLIYELIFRDRNSLRIQLHINFYLAGPKIVKQWTCTLHTTLLRTFVPHPLVGRVTVWAHPNKEETPILIYRWVTKQGNWVWELYYDLLVILMTNSNCNVEFQLWQSPTNLITLAAMVPHAFIHMWCWTS